MDLPAFVRSRVRGGRGGSCAQILLGKLARYRGTEEDDAARLAAGGLEDSTRLALEFRLHERAALRRVIDALDSGRVNL